jgi:hypothetical protein
MRKAFTLRDGRQFASFGHILANALRQIEPCQIFADQSPLASGSSPQRFIFRPQPIHRITGDQLVKFPAPGSGKFAGVQVITR